MSITNHPTIGSHLLTGYDHIYDEKGIPKFSLITLDGGTFEEENYPLLFDKLGSNVLESRNSGDTRVPYKIVGDYHA